MYSLFFSILVRVGKPLNQVQSTLEVKSRAVASFRKSFSCLCVNLEYNLVLLMLITEKAHSQSHCKHFLQPGVSVWGYFIKRYC